MQDLVTRLRSVARRTEARAAYLNARSAAVEFEAPALDRLNAFLIADRIAAETIAVELTETAATLKRTGT